MSLEWHQCGSDGNRVFAFKGFEPFEKLSEDDLLKIEKRMKEIVDRDEVTKKEVWKRDKAISHFKNIGEHYKAEIIEDIPKNEEVSILQFSARTFFTASIASL